MRLRGTPLPKRSGFTIVELLIVIVVIAILAAIVIIAYQGIQNKAHSAAAQAASNTLAKLLTNSYTTNGIYPSDLSTINNGNPMPSTDGSTYAYHPGSGNTSYCVTVTNGNNSYKVTDTATQPVSGGCPGDGVGGVGAITNLAGNPSIETNAAGYSANGTVTLAQSSDYALNGASSLKVTTTGTTNVGVSFSVPVVAGKTYTLSGSVYFPAAFGTGVRPCAWGAAMGGLSCGGYGSTVGSWQRLSYTFQAVNTASVTLYFYDAGTQPAIGSLMYVDGVMLTEGSTTPNYADGNSPSWIWNGAVNNSTSTGPPQ